MRLAKEPKMVGWEIITLQFKVKYYKDEIACYNSLVGLHLLPQIMEYRDMEYFSK